MQNDPHFLSFVTGVAKIREDYRVRAGLTYLTAMGAEFSIEPRSKFARVNSNETTKDGKSQLQIYAFVALEDGFNKQLGSFKKGDIFKPATYKAPAKHARGNIYDEKNGLEKMGQYSPVYLR